MRAKIAGAEQALTDAQAVADRRIADLQAQLEEVMAQFATVTVHVSNAAKELQLEPAV